MRNLKKILSLALALMMVLSVMVQATIFVTSFKTCGKEFPVLSCAPALLPVSPAKAKPSLRSFASSCVRQRSSVRVSSPSLPKKEQGPQKWNMSILRPHSAEQNL